jgi:hypothetical protein
LKIANHVDSTRQILLIGIKDDNIEKWRLALNAKITNSSESLDLALKEIRKSLASKLGAKFSDGSVVDNTASVSDFASIQD